MVYGPVDAEALKERMEGNLHILEKRNGEEENPDPRNIVEESFRSFFGDGSLKDILGNNENICMVINDRNRPTPSYLILEHLLENEGWIKERLGKVHIATGTHKAPSEEDIRYLLGGTYELLRDLVHIHDARDEGSHVNVYDTSRGTTVMLDTEFIGHDAYIFINSVEPHYFAGFTGGRKSIIPGMAAYSTVETNHSQALSEGSKTLCLEGNPVHEDMEEAAEAFLKDRKYISFQMVQGPDKLLTSLHIGDMEGSFREGVERAVEEFCIPIEQRYDIVITVARSPMDRTLYQAQKAIENGKLALKDGGVLILVAGCSEGIGQSTFWDLITDSKDLDDILATIEKSYLLGYHKAAKIVQLLKRASIFVVGDLPSYELERGFMEAFSDLDGALERAYEKLSLRPKVLLIPDGTVTVPMIEEEHK